MNQFDAGGPRQNFAGAPTPHIVGTVSRAMGALQRGNLDEAEVLFNTVLASDRNHFEALHYLGVLKAQRGQHEQAVDLINKSLQVKKNVPQAFSNLARVLNEMGRHEDAVVTCTKALAIRPDLIDALVSRGIAFRNLGRINESLADIEKTLSIKPDYYQALVNRGIALIQLKRYDEAGRSLDKALKINSRSSIAFFWLGCLYERIGRLDDALLNYDRALSVGPDNHEALMSWARVLTQLKRYDEAAAALDAMLAANPRSAEAFTCLGNVRQTQGRIEDALQAYDRALAINPDYEMALSNKIFTLDFKPGTSFADHQAARRDWWERVGLKISTSRRPNYRNFGEDSRRLTIGYVSADFRQHSAAFTFLPVLRCHDKTKFQVICYSNSHIEDDLTGEFKKTVDLWRDITSMTDEATAALVEQDGVDILVDLSGHSAGNRLRLFVLKPAPVQVTAWGHATGTGIPRIDYLFADSVGIPPSARHLFAENIIDLPCMVFLEKPQVGVQLKEPPALRHGLVTFGSLNRLSKISDECIAVWGQILKAVPTARLLLKDGALDSASSRETITAKFLQQGISNDRISLLGQTSRQEHLEVLNEVDIGLDPFPQNGGISTWDALHMGVPVVAILGNSVPSRLGGSILSAIGLSDWVADSTERYIEIACMNANEPLLLSKLRTQIPKMIAASPAGNALSYCSAVEAAYQTIWKTYIDSTRRNDLRVDSMTRLDEASVRPGEPAQDR